MSKIVWDASGEHFYETGVDHGVLYNYSNGAFGSGVAWNGLTAVNESPSGAEATPLYADNIKYLNLMSAEEYNYTIEAYSSPEEFDRCDGTLEVADGVTIGQQDRELFGFCYRTLKGNDTEGAKAGYVLHLVYNSLASPSAKNHTTVNDSPEAATLSWEVKTTPVPVSGAKPTATLTVDSTKTPAGKLADLEEILYGKAGVDPRLPFPDEVIELIGTAGSVTGVTVTPSSATITVGETFQLSTATVPLGREVTYESSETDYATVSGSGVVTGVAAGSATITATFVYNDVTYTDTCSVTVVSAG